MRSLSENGRPGRWLTAIASTVALLAVAALAYADNGAVMTPPPASVPAATTGSDDSVPFNWTDVPQNQNVLIKQASFDQVSFQLLDTVGETVLVPNSADNKSILMFAHSTDGTMYFVNTGKNPVLYVPAGGYLGNAVAPGQRWYPFGEPAPTAPTPASATVPTGQNAPPVGDAAPPVILAPPTTAAPPAAPPTTAAPPAAPPTTAAPPEAPPTNAAPPEAQETTASADPKVFNWSELPKDQSIPLAQATFDKSGYQLYDTAGETILVPFVGNNLNVMKFQYTSTATMYLVNTGDYPVLHIPDGGYLENADVAGARWYPFPANFRPANPVYVDIAPTWGDYVAMGWYPAMYCYGGYWGDNLIVTPGYGFMIGGESYHDWNKYQGYQHHHPGGIVPGGTHGSPNDPGGTHRGPNDPGGTHGFHSGPSSVGARSFGAAPSLASHRFHGAEAKAWMHSDSWSRHAAGWSRPFRGGTSSHSIGGGSTHSNGGVSHSTGGGSRPR